MHLSNYSLRHNLPPKVDVIPKKKHFAKRLLDRIITQNAKQRSRSPDAERSVSLVTLLRTLTHIHACSAFTRHSCGVPEKSRNSLRSANSRPVNSSKSLKNRAPHADTLFHYFEPPQIATLISICYSATISTV